MDKYGKLISPGTLKFERLLPGPIERVWKYITDSELRGKWFASGNMELKKGGELHFFFFHDQFTDEPDTVPEKYKNMAQGHHSKGKVLEIEAPRMLKFTWDNEGEVTITLTEEGDKVKLLLIHEKLEGQETIIGGSAGWHTHLDILVDNLEGIKPKPFWKIHMIFEVEYRERFFGK
jgi:uncharacterized protein YndB with AHSA1/START domain